MPDARTIQQNIQMIRALSNDLAAFLHSLPEDVWREAEVYASACDRWNMADVVAHLIDIAGMMCLSIERAKKGNVAPPMGYRRLTPDEWVDSVVRLREAFDEDLFPEFNASCLRLNRLLIGLEPEQYELPAWHPAAVLDISRIIEIRAMELAVHGWDIRYGIDRSAAINPLAIPFLKGWLYRWLRIGFRPQTGLESVVRLRFELTDSEGESYDLSVRSDNFLLASADHDERPDAIISLDSSSYILFLMGRVPIRRSIRRSRIALEGDQALAERFTDWFVGV